LGEDYDCSSKTILKNVLFIILASNFFGIISNIHNIFAFAIVCLAIFRDLYLKEKNGLTILLYIIPCFLHYTAAIFIVIRLVLFLPKMTRRIISILILISTFLVESLYNISISERFNETNIVAEFINKLVKAAYYYLLDETSSYAVITKASSLQFVTKVVFVILAVCFLILGVLLNKSLQFHGEDDKKVNVERLVSLFNMVCIMVLACVPMTLPEYWRFSAVVTIMSAVIFVPFTSLKIHTKLYSLLKWIIWLMAFSNFLLSVFRLFVIYDYSSLFTNFVSTCPMIEFVRLVLNSLLNN
jgi:hypothetical protein